MVNYWSAMTALSLSQALLAHADCMSYSTATVTECGPTPTPAPPIHHGPDGVVTILMPDCPSCSCDCAYTKTYTTTFDVFCPTGVAKTTYTINEVYKGMSTAPAFATPTVYPHGFTTTVATCTTCGSAPLVKTLTYPATGKPSAPPSGPAQPGTQGSPQGSGQSGTTNQGQGCSGAGCTPVVGAAPQLESGYRAVLAVLAAFFFA